MTREEKFAEIMRQHNEDISSGKFEFYEKWNRQNSKTPKKQKTKTINHVPVDKSLKNLDFFQQDDEQSPDCD